MPRVTKADLERENADLKAELNKARERSRSRKRKVHFEAEPLSAAGYRALDIVCKHNRDPVIEEQRATIAKLRKEHARQIADKDAEIADYRIGNGQIAPVLMAAHRMSDLGYHAKNQTVAQYVHEMFRKYNGLTSDILFGLRR